jgi:dihydroxyacid dehydratase/phosphogluconate dehydratase
MQAGTIDTPSPPATRPMIELCIPAAELEQRLASWAAPSPTDSRGVLARYGRQAAPASQGASFD